MTHYYYDNTNNDPATSNIITELLLEQAEKGLNYLDPERFLWLGDFESADAARSYLVNLYGQSEFCYKYDI